MTAFVAETEIQNHFVTGWDDETPVAQDNVSFEPQSVTEYVRFVDDNAGARQVSLGDNPRFRYRGLVTVQAFLKPNTGTSRAMELFDLVTEIFRAQKVGSVQFEVPRMNTVGDRDGWYQVNFLCPYYRDEE